MNHPPFKIHSVDSVTMPDGASRKHILEEANYNVFCVSAEDVYLDMLTDSGTGALSKRQLGAMLQGDERYAGSKSFEAFEETVRELTGYQHVFPVHQGRAAERILFSLLVDEGDRVPSNTHFDTTRGNIKYNGGIPVDLPAARTDRSESVFSGNMDTTKLREELSRDSNIPLSMMTVTNNSFAGRPVSLRNIRSIRNIAKEHGIPFFLDAARFAENAYWMFRHESENSFSTPAEAAEATFRASDGCLMSAKKDGLAHIGGMLCLNDDELAEEVKQLLILTEGFPTYGGLAGRDLEAIRVGLMEMLDESYLRYRYERTREIEEQLSALDVPFVRPVALHAIYLDAGAFLSHIPPDRFPGVALSNQLYIEGGIRSVEIGSLMYGNDARPMDRELTRLCIPRRTLTKEHLEHLFSTLETIQEKKEEIPGLELTKEPELVRHFSAELQPVHPFPDPEDADRGEN